MSNAGSRTQLDTGVPVYIDEQWQGIGELYMVAFDPIVVNNLNDMHMMPCFVPELLHLDTFDRHYIAVDTAPEFEYQLNDASPTCCGINNKASTHHRTRVKRRKSQRAARRLNRG